MNLPELEATGGRTALGEMPPVNSERPKKKKPKVNSTVDNNALAAWWGARASAAGSCRNIKDELTPNASDSITYEVDVHEFTSQTASGECDPLEIDNALADADPISYEPPVKTIKVEKSIKIEEPEELPVEELHDIVEPEIHHESAQPCQIQPEAAAVDCGLPQDELVDSHCEEDQCSSDEGEPVIDTVFSVVDQPGCVNLMSASSGVVVREPADADSPDGYSWTSEDVTSQEIPFPWKPGLQCPMYPATPYDFFRCVIGKRFYMIFINQVNKCAFEMGVETKKPSRKKKPKSKTLVSQWKTLSEDQLEIWLAILIQMGGIQNPSFTHYWSSEIMHKSSFFAEVAMTKDRWLGIMQTLHFMGRPSGSEKTEPFFKAGPLVTCFNEQMKKLYVPDRELCVEEPVILWKGRLVPWGFLKDKKDATKLHTVSEPGGLILRFYTDKMDISDESAASKVVRRVLADFMDKGHSIFMARCYTGVDLCHELLSRQVHTTGPLLPTRKNIPERILTSNPQPENVVYTRSNHGVVVMKFTDNIDQYLFVSSEFNPFLLKSTYKSFSKLKPEAITAYDKFISGISNSYCHLSDYGAVLQHTTSHVRITIHLIEIAVYNAFVLYKKYSTNCLDFAAFRADLVRRLAGLKKSFKK